MNRIEAYADGFRVNYEKFLVGCDALEEKRNAALLKELCE